MDSFDTSRDQPPGDRVGSRRRLQRLGYWPMKVGDHVRILLPDNPMAHEKSAIIREDRGAYFVLATAFGTGEFRATREELEAVNPQHNGHWKQARQVGYTGSICDLCGGCRMVRSGVCERCEDCGSTSGCS